MVAYWETVVALFIGFLVFGETMTVLAMIGGAMIVPGGSGRSCSIKARKGRIGRRRGCRGRTHARSAGKVLAGKAGGNLPSGGHQRHGDSAQEGAPLP